ncbi:GNAT family N-acetyltransferase [Chishuiella sp.]|uniref:GNAT family N-acetyltransferase n=1 Tax=Chishuiella sp. TaxID=1969467 RepID=UPI0028B25F27|nr:GNAT family N-acetyltransferase [Chishuiella sp.]
MNIKIIETSPTDYEVIPLIELLSNELEQRFGSSGKNSFIDWDNECKKSIFVKVYINNEIVGCGAFRPISNEIAELKRMYAKYPRKGIGEIILNYLEEKAKSLDYITIWLETRKLNHEACQFYLKNGYQKIENYGKYIGNDKAICFGKKLINK